MSAVFNWNCYDMSDRRPEGNKKTAKGGWLGGSHAHFFAEFTESVPAIRITIAAYRKKAPLI